MTCNETFRKWEYFHKFKFLLAVYHPLNCTYEKLYRKRFHGNLVKNINEKGCTLDSHVFQLEKFSFFE